MTSASDDNKARARGVWRVLSPNSATARVVQVRSGSIDSDRVQAGNVPGSSQRAATRASGSQQHSVSEPITAVVRKVTPRPSRSVSARPSVTPRLSRPVSVTPSARAPLSQPGTPPERPSHIEVRKSKSAVTRPDLPAAMDKVEKTWRCLEWQPERPRAKSLTPAPSAPPAPAPPSSSEPERASVTPRGEGVTRVELSQGGKLLASTQVGDEELLAESIAFTHRLATLTARALGFKRCNAMYLRGTSGAIAVSEREGNIVGVSGTLARMSEPLRKVGLE